MNKFKITYVALFILCFLLMAFTFLKIKHQREFQRKAIFATELQKALNHLMVDLSQTHESTIQDVPADGLWHKRVLGYFVKDDRLLRVYKSREWVIANNITELDIRRQKIDPAILEVKIKAQMRVLLTYDLRIRIHP